MDFKSQSLEDRQVGKEAEEAGGDEAQEAASQILGLGPALPLPNLVTRVDSPHLSFLTVEHRDCVDYSSACLRS